LTFRIQKKKKSQTTPKSLLRKRKKPRDPDKIPRKNKPKSKKLVRRLLI
jgi:hypothetical protein